METKLPKIIKDDFLEMINQQIENGNNVGYLKQVLVDFNQYQEAFDKAFSLENSHKKIYTFRANYKNKKPVWRDIEVYGNQYFVDFAEEIIFSMDWDNDHMHGFSLYEKGKYIFGQDSHFFYAPFWEDDPFPTYKTSQIKICHIDYAKYPHLGFIFDFGDGHEFDIQFKGIRDKKSDEYVDDFPVLVDQRGVAPEQYPPVDDDSFFDDDCLLCRAMRDGDDSLESLTEKFKQMEDEEKKKLPFKELG